MPAAARDILVVRHGITDWNESGRLMGRGGVGLNARGHAEAEALADALRALPLRAVIASPQQRTQETAAVIADAQGLAVHTEPDLDEVWVDRWQGKTWEELRDDPDMRAYLDDPGYVCGAIEPLASVRARVVGAVERLCAAQAEGRLLLVSHGDPIRVLLAHHLGMRSVDYRRLLVSTGSLSVLRFGASPGPRLVLLNWKPPAALPRILS